ncbi:MAG: hypothetical protein EBV15_11615 [Bacteroidetes bacterium]|nr:hypothetical protein [Bacteroidota bacterium]
MQDNSIRKSKKVEKVMGVRQDVVQIDTCVQSLRITARLSFAVCVAFFVVRLLPTLGFPALEVLQQG